uniref:Uncharacterized protein n=1 Tax=Myoviridae sp. ct2th6 TaxID=2826606 RepID=A0A8S5NN16_9CAUD|nr:MAG TPA: hypothetical protein [Myoviridae sp. ct2th6]DAH33910.1 MAG TPA: hypothetical protein [Caudoviricetes sp.]
MSGGLCICACGKNFILHIPEVAAGEETDRG